MPRKSRETDPTPEQVLEYIAAAISGLYEAAWGDTEMGGPFQESLANIDAGITLATIKQAVIARMATDGMAFSSDYRHEETPMHSIVYRMLGSTVEMNDRIAKVHQERR